MNALNEAGAAQDPAMWTVFDSNAKVLDHSTGQFKARVHEVRPGKSYPLYSDRPTRMPESDARVFLRDESFKVMDAKGNQVLPLKLQAMEREVPKRLEPEFVVAEVQELSTEALVTRAAMFPGGGQYNTETPRAALIRFLISAQRARDATNTAGDDAPQGRDLPPEERRDIDRQADPDQMDAKQLQDSFG